MPSRSLLVAGLASVLLALAACSQPQRPNVLFIVLDTLRKDYLHVYGYPQPVSPAIDALAARGWLFENHLTHASQTIPATLSMLLSRLPAEHGFSPRDPMLFATERPLYPPDFVFLQEVFRDAGYTTAGFTANPYLTRSNAFDQGFETFVSIAGPGEDLNRSAIAWLTRQTRERPFFAYLHYMDVHQPYQPPARYVERFAAPEAGVLLGGNRPLPMQNSRDVAYTRSMYAASVAHLDDLVAEVLHQLDSLGLRDDTLVVLTADHGESLGEHALLGHGRALYGELVRVPLVMVFPGRLEPGRRVSHLSQHIYLAPTILQLAGIDPPREFRGTSVFEPAERVFLEIGTWRGVVAEGSKLLWNQATGEQQLFALSDELDSAPREDAEIATRLQAQLDGYLALDPNRNAPGGPQPGNNWSKDEIERLRALGYLN